MTKACLEFLHSEPFFRLLSHLTGLELAENIIKPNLEELVATSDDPAMISDDLLEEEDTMVPPNLLEGEQPKGKGSRSGDDSGTSEVLKSSAQTAGKVTVEESHSESVIKEFTVSANCDGSSDAQAEVSPPTCVSGSHSSSQNENCVPAASCHGDLYHWQPGDYTLANDSDPELGEYVLDATLFFSCEGSTHIAIVAHCMWRCLEVSESVCDRLCRLVTGFWWYDILHCQG